MLTTVRGCTSCDTFYLMLCMCFQADSVVCICRSRHTWQTHLHLHQLLLQLVAVTQHLLRTRRRRRRKRKKRNLTRTWVSVCLIRRLQQVLAPGTAFKLCNLLCLDFHSAAPYTIYHRAAALHCPKMHQATSTTVAPEMPCCGLKAERVEVSGTRFTWEY